MRRIRMLATRNVWAPHDHICGGDSPDVQWLETLVSLTPPPARPPWRPARPRRRPRLGRPPLSQWGRAPRRSHRASHGCQDDMEADPCPQVATTCGPMGLSATPPPPQPGAFENAAVAQAAQNLESPAHYWSGSEAPSRPGASNPSTLPWWDRKP